LPDFDMNDNARLLDELRRQVEIGARRLRVNPPLRWGDAEIANARVMPQPEEVPYVEPTSKKGIWYNEPFFVSFRNYVRQKKEGEVGIEIEVEGKNLQLNPITYWVEKPDGSLRDYQGRPEYPGNEYVLSNPLSRESIPKALRYLGRKMKDAGSEVHLSSRCSVHVHINCQTLSMKQIYQIICLYGIFEEALVEFSGEERVGNLFCLRAKDAEYWIRQLILALQSKDFDRVFDNDIRYTSCNTASLGKFGSLEFRSMRGTVDINLIQSWVDILLHIKDVALSYEDPAALMTDAIQSSKGMFGRKIFIDKPELYSLIETDHIDQSIRNGIRVMRDVAFCTEWRKK